MITFVEHKDIDLSRWDLCIAQSVNPIVYASSWYLNKVAPEWNALVLGNYDAVMPLVHHKKYFINYLYQPFFTQQLGIFSKITISQELLEDFIKAIPKKYRYVDIHLNEHNQILNNKFKIKKRKNYLLSLEKPYDKISKGFAQHTKRQLKKAKKHALELRSVPFTDVVKFYKLHKSALTKGVNEDDYQMLLSLLGEASERKHLLSKGIYNSSGELLACGVFVHFYNRLIFLMGTASDLGKEFGAMYVLFDHIILQYAEHSLMLDFEGSEIPGVARFFKGFGAEKSHYYHLKINRLPFFIKLFKK